MTPLEAALAYTVPVFPCSQSRRPRTPRGFYDATTDPAVVTAWWNQWPAALIGMRTGRASGRYVLDIDVKKPGENGFDSLEDLGYQPLPATPMAHTQTGGVHVYFRSERELRNSTGDLAPGLDVRGDGGYVILPSPGSGYAWDPIWNFDTIGMAPAPDWLWPVKPARQPLPAGPIKPVSGLSPYGTAAIERACDAIAKAPHGQQERTLNAECFSIGTAVGAGIIPHDIALQALLRAAAAMPDYDPRLPWRYEEIDHKVRRAFAAGCANPREVRRAVA
jgi:hypothetical protein